MAAGQKAKGDTMALIRVLMVALVFQTVVFASLWFFARARRREKLQEEWSLSDRTEPLESYIQSGAQAYESALWRKLLLGVYVVPSCALALLIYLTSSG